MAEAQASQATQAIQTTTAEGKRKTQAQYISGKLRQEQNKQIMGAAFGHFGKAHGEIAEAKKRSKEAKREFKKARHERDDLIKQRKNAPREQIQDLDVKIKAAKEKTKKLRREKKTKFKEKLNILGAKLDVRTALDRSLSDADAIFAIVRVAVDGMREPLAKLSRAKRVEKVLREIEEGGVAGLALRHIPNKVARGLGALSKEQIQSVSTHHQALESLAKEAKTADKAGYGERIIDQIIAGNELHQKIADALLNGPLVEQLKNVAKLSKGQQEAQRVILGRQLRIKLQEIAKEFPEDAIAQEFLGTNATKAERQATAEGLIDMCLRLGADNLEQMRQEMITLEKVHKGSGYFEDQYNEWKSIREFALKNVRTGLAVGAGLHLLVNPLTTVPTLGILAAGGMTFFTQKHKMQYDRGIALIDKARGIYQAPEEQEGTMGLLQKIWGKELDLSVSNKEFNSQVNRLAAYRGVIVAVMSFTFGAGGHEVIGGALGHAGEMIHGQSQPIQELSVMSVQTDGADTVPNIDPASHLNALANATDIHQQAAEINSLKLDMNTFSDPTGKVHADMTQLTKDFGTPNGIKADITTMQQDVANAEQYTAALKADDALKTFLNNAHTHIADGDMKAYSADLEAAQKAMGQLSNPADQTTAIHHLNNIDYELRNEGALPPGASPNELQQLQDQLHALEPPKAPHVAPMPTGSGDAPSLAQANVYQQRWDEDWSSNVPLFNKAGNLAGDAAGFLGNRIGDAMAHVIAPPAPSHEAVSGSSGGVLPGTESAQNVSATSLFEHHTGVPEIHHSAGDMNGADHFGQPHDPVTGHTLGNPEDASDKILGTWQGNHTAFGADGQSIDFYGTYPGSQEFIQFNGHYYLFHAQTMTLGNNTDIGLTPLDGGSPIPMTQDQFLHMVGYGDPNSIQAGNIVNATYAQWAALHHVTGTMNASDRLAQIHDPAWLARHPGFEQLLKQNLTAAKLPTDNLSYIHPPALQMGEAVVNGPHSIDIIAQNQDFDPSHFQDTLPGGGGLPNIPGVPTTLPHGLDMFKLFQEYPGEAALIAIPWIIGTGYLGYRGGRKFVRENTARARLIYPAAGASVLAGGVLATTSLAAAPGVIGAGIGMLVQRFRGNGGSSSSSSSSSGNSRNSRDSRPPGNSPQDPGNGGGSNNQGGSNANTNTNGDGQNGNNGGDNGGGPADDSGGTQSSTPSPASRLANGARSLGRNANVARAQRFYNTTDPAALMLQRQQKIDANSQLTGIGKLNPQPKAGPQLIADTLNVQAKKTDSDPGFVSSDQIKSISDIGRNSNLGPTDAGVADLVAKNESASSDKKLDLRDEYNARVAASALGYDPSKQRDFNPAVAQLQRQTAAQQALKDPDITSKDPQDQIPLVQQKMKELMTPAGLTPTEARKESLILDEAFTSTIPDKDARRKAIAQVFSNESEEVRQAVGQELHVTVPAATQAPGTPDAQQNTVGGEGHKQAVLTARDQFIHAQNALQAQDTQANKDALNEAFRESVSYVGAWPETSLSQDAKDAKAAFIDKLRSLGPNLPEHYTDFPHELKDLYTTYLNKVADAVAASPAQPAPPAAPAVQLTSTGPSRQPDAPNVPAGTQRTALDVVPNDLEQNPPDQTQPLAVPIRDTIPPGAFDGNPLDASSDSSGVVDPRRVQFDATRNITPVGEQVAGEFITKYVTDDVQRNWPDKWPETTDQDVLNMDSLRENLAKFSPSELRQLERQMQEPSSYQRAQKIKGALFAHEALARPIGGLDLPPDDEGGALPLTLPPSYVPLTPNGTPTGNYLPHPEDGVVGDSVEQAVRQQYDQARASVASQNPSPFPSHPTGQRTVNPNSGFPDSIHTTLPPAAPPFLGHDGLQSGPDGTSAASLPATSVELASTGGKVPVVEPSTSPSPERTPEQQRNDFNSAYAEFRTAYYKWATAPADQKDGRVPALQLAYAKMTPILSEIYPSQKDNSAIRPLAYDTFSQLSRTIQRQDQRPDLSPSEQIQQAFRDIPFADLPLTLQRKYVRLVDAVGWEVNGKKYPPIPGNSGRDYGMFILAQVDDVLDQGGHTTPMSAVVPDVSVQAGSAPLMQTQTGSVSAASIFDTHQDDSVSRYPALELYGNGIPPRASDQSPQLTEQQAALSQVDTTEHPFVGGEQIQTVALRQPARTFAEVMQSANTTPTVEVNSTRIKTVAQQMSKLAGFNLEQTPHALQTMYDNYEQLVVDTLRMPDRDKKRDALSALADTFGLEQGSDLATKEPVEIFAQAMIHAAEHPVHDTEVREMSERYFRIQEQLHGSSQDNNVEKLTAEQDSILDVERAIAAAFLTHEGIDASKVSARLAIAIFNAGMHTDSTTALRKFEDIQRDADVPADFPQPEKLLQDFRDFVLQGQGGIVEKQPDGTYTFTSMQQKAVDADALKAQITSQLEGYVSQKVTNGQKVDENPAVQYVDHKVGANRVEKGIADEHTQDLPEEEVQLTQQEIVTDLADKISQLQDLLDMPVDEQAQNDEQIRDLMEEVLGDIDDLDESTRDSIYATAAGERYDGAMHMYFDTQNKQKSNRLLALLHKPSQQKSVDDMYNELINLPYSQHPDEVKHIYRDYYQTIGKGAQKYLDERQQEQKAQVRDRGINESMRAVLETIPQSSDRLTLIKKAGDIAEQLAELPNVQDNWYSLIPLQVLAGNKALFEQYLQKQYPQYHADPLFIDGIREQIAGLESDGTQGLDVRFEYLNRFGVALQQSPILA